MRYVPLFLAVEGARIVVAGAGEAARAKLRLFAKTRARLALIAPAIPAVLAREAEGLGAAVHRRELAASDLVGCRLLVVAEEDAERRRVCAELARRAGVPVNAVDDPALSDVIVPAIVDRDPVVVAIGSEGEAPVLARRIRARIEALLPEGTGRLARFAGRLRPRVTARFVSATARREFFERLFDGPVAGLVLSGREGEAQVLAERMLEATEDLPGGVVLLAIASDDPDLLTLGALDALQRADLLVADDGVGPRLLERARRDAERVVRCAVPDCPGTDHAGTVRLVIAAARSGRRVVRLVTSRARLETERRALAASGLPARVLPGTATPLWAPSAGDGAFPVPFREQEEVHA